MPFNAEQLSYAGKIAMDYIMRGSPTDIYNTDRPLLKALQATKKSFPGAKQYINEKLRTTNDSNFQWFGPDAEVSYNRKRTISEANFAWGSAHDGFALTEEELLQNYISVTDNKNNAPTTDEQRQFVNLITENTETLKLGFTEKFDYDLHLDGTQNPDAIPGLDLLVSTTPATGVVGGIDRATTPAWRNYAALNIAATPGLLNAALETAWRSTTRVGGNSPNLILAGSKAIDAYRNEQAATQQRHIVMNPTSSGVPRADGSFNDLSFKGVPIVWDPVMDDLQAALAPATAWDKRMYLLNTRFLKLRPAEGQDMVVRNPPRVYNRYTHYWGLTWRGALTITRPSAMAVISVA
jgi:hypothetical protein